MNYILLIGLLLSAPLTAQPLPSFTYEGKTLHVVEQVKLTHPIVHDDPIIPGEDERIRLFRNYFHPASLASFQAFYLSRDWFGLSLQQFNDWQAGILKKKLHLQNIFHLRNSQQEEFLVYQYTMESEAYSVFQSTEFKKTSSGWKHTSQQNDAMSAFLCRIGALQINTYEEQLKGATTIQLDVLQPDQLRSYVEKFDRSVVFIKIETLLREKGVTQSDIDHARMLFTQRDDTGFVEYVTGEYNFDDIDFMNRINTATGVQLYRSSRIQQD